MAKDSFYSAFGDWTDKLVAGTSLKLEHTVKYEEFRIDIPEIGEIVTLSIPELEQRRKDSAKLEQDIFSRIQGNVKEWEAQAAQTLLLDKAMEYVNTPQVAHTSNQWTQLKDGSWEISNLVYKMCYKMCYKMWEDEAGDKKGPWLVTWALGVNRPKRPLTERFNFNGEFIIAEQKKKRYDSFDAAQRYIQGRFDVYAHHFSELRPPVPAEFKKHFYINGCLLPGYTVAPPEGAGPNQETVEALLEFVEDGDTPPPPTIGPAESVPRERKPAPSTGKKPAAPAPRPNRKKSKTSRSKGGIVR